MVLTSGWCYCEALIDNVYVSYGQPKLVINNIDVLRNATLNDDSSVSASMYHDSLIWRMIALGANERCLPIILVTSDRLGPFLFSYAIFYLLFKP